MPSRTSTHQQGFGWALNDTVLGQRHTRDKRAWTQVRRGESKRSMFSMARVAFVRKLLMRSKSMDEGLRVYFDCRSNGSGFTDGYTFALSLGSTLPLSGPSNRAVWRKDRRMAAYHNAVSGSTNTIASKETPNILDKCQG